MDSFRRGRGLYDDIPWGGGVWAHGMGRAPPRHTREDSLKTDSEVRRIREEGNDRDGFGCIFQINKLGDITEL